MTVATCYVLLKLVLFGYQVLYTWNEINNESENNWVFPLIRYLHRYDEDFKGPP